MEQNSTLSTREAAQRLGVSKMTVNRLYQTGQLTGYKLNPDKRNSHLRIYTESVEDMLRQRQTQKEA